MKRRIISILLAVMLLTVVCLGTACTPNTPDTDPSGTDGTTPSSPNELDALTEGYYAYGYAVEGYGNMDRFLRFYDNGIVYYGQAGGGGSQGYVYYYTVEETDYTYSVWYTREERVNSAEKYTGTAKYTVTISDMNDSKSYTLGFDGTYLYSGDVASCEFIIADAQTMRFNHDAENEGGYTEINQVILKMEKDGDPTAFIELNHNGTYSDMINLAIDGTYTLSKSSDGVTTYKLVPNLSSDTPATLVVSADGKTATYTPDGGEAIQMKTESNAEVSISLTGNAKLTQGEMLLDVVYKLDLYSDSTCQLLLSVGGTETPYDSGTFALAADYSFDFTFGKLGLIHSTMDTSDPSNIIYVVVIPADTEAGITEATLSNGEIVSSNQLTLEGTHSAGNFPAKLVLNEDGTAEYTIEMPEAYGGTIVTPGTWNDEKASFEVAGTVLDIALTNQSGYWTGVNAEQAISLSNAQYVLTGTHSAGNFPATLVLLADGTAIYTIEMPAAYGGTMVTPGTWANEKASFEVSGTTLDLTLTIADGIVTATNSEQQIGLTNEQ